MEQLTKGYYSVIQYSPDRGSFEAANVGVILFVPELGMPRFLLSASGTRAQKMFGNELDKANLRTQLESFRRRMELEHIRWRTVEDLEQFAALLANSITMTRPRPMRVTNPETDLQALYTELVGGESTKRDRRPKAEVKKRIDAIFRRPSLKGRIVVKPQVIVPIVDRAFPVPYGYQNGAFNLVRPEVFPADESNALGKAEKLMAEAAMIQRYTERSAIPQRVIIVSEILDSAFPSKSKGLEAKIEAMFREFDIRVVTLEEVEAFGQEVEREAHLP